jgi:hypothetical protein
LNHHNFVVPTPPFMSSDTSFQYSDFKPVVSRKKRKHKVQSERPPLLTTVERTREELAKDDWNAQCQRPFNWQLTTSPGNILCRNFARPFDCPCLVSFATSLSGSREPIIFAKLSCSASLSTRDMQVNCHRGSLCAVPPCWIIRVQENGNVSIYDPVFSEEDNALFQELGFRVLSENKASRHCFQPDLGLPLIPA